MITNPIASFPKDKRSSDGYDSACKACKRYRNQQWEKSNLEKVRAHRKEYYKNTRERSLLKSSVWQKKNKDRLNAYRRTWYKKHRNNEEFRKRASVRTRAWQSRNIAFVKAKQKEWRIANHDKKIDQSNRRRARLKNAPIIEKIDRLAIANRDGWRCHICGKKIKRTDLALDHLIPLSKGGPHTSSNLASAHLSCNAKRGPGRIPAQLLLFS